MFFVENSGKNQEGSDVAPSMYQSISLTLSGKQGLCPVILGQTED